MKFIIKRAAKPFVLTNPNLRAPISNKDLLVAFGYSVLIFVIVAAALIVAMTDWSVK